MFTGIIETIGKIASITMDGEHLILDIESNLGLELKVDQSVSHNGICLTVTHIDGLVHTVCAVGETIKKTSISHWKQGDELNLERGMLLHHRLDGHLVQGHVDTVGVCIARNEGSFRFEVNTSFKNLFIEKGSITINGISLTCFNVGENSFEVAIIPYTYEHTTIGQVIEGSLVNIEFDVIGKYILRSQGL